MRKILRALFWCGAVAVLLAVGWSSLRYFGAEATFKRRFAAVVQSGAPEVDFRKLSGPSWQRVYIFGPYSYPDQISSALGFPCGDTDLKDVTSSDGAYLLLFVKDQRVVLSIGHSRRDGEFAPEAFRRSFTPDEARFAIARQSADHRIFLTPLFPANDVPNTALQPTAKGGG